MDLKDNINKIKINGPYIKENRGSKSQVKDKENSEVREASCKES